MARARCWKDYDDWLRDRGRDAEANERLIDGEVGKSCMLWQEHDGPHDFVPDDEISVSFAAAPDAGEVPDENDA
jgi:hypothetical protein